MNLGPLIEAELTFLKKFNLSSISISTTARHALDFIILPRRKIGELGMSSFMINDEKLLKEVLLFFDGKIDYIFIDVELKQKINLYEIASKIVKNSKLLSVKPNDNTLESTDLLVRNFFEDNLINKNIVIIGTGNLACKIAIRLAERQGNIYIIGRNKQKELSVINSINLFLPKFTKKIKTFDEFPLQNNADLVISALSGQFMDEELLYPLLTETTLIIDVGINNFSKTFIEFNLKNNIKIVRLDTRISLPYQFLFDHIYVKQFFNDIFGQGNIDNIPVVSGGFIGSEGSVIVDNIKSPTQVIGIADGKGGVKENEQLNDKERNRIQKIREKISEND